MARSQVATQSPLGGWRWLLMLAGMVLALAAIAVEQSREVTPSVMDGDEANARSSLDLSVSEDDFGPAVVIQDFYNRQIEEYSVNGNRYMMKVTPRVGRPYYLVDTDGTGDLEWRRNASGMDIRPPQWSITRW